MDRNFRKSAHDEADASPPSEAWLFAQALLGKPIPNPASGKPMPAPSVSTWSGLRGEKSISELPKAVRQRLAGLYSRVAAENSPGSAQAAFNQARANYLLGKGPNPGESVVQFAERTGLPIFKRGGLK